MKIWFVEIGEPLPMEENARLLRYGHMTRWLASQGHDVLWWASSFSHAPKKHVVDTTRNGPEWNIEGVRIFCLDGPGYKKNVSFARLKHQRITAENLSLNIPAEIVKNGKPDLIITPVPSLETAYTISDFAQTHNIPYIVDIRDHWPEDYLLKFPKFLRPFGQIILHQSFQDLRFICEGASGITGVTNMQRDYGLRYASRRLNTKRDQTTYIGYSAHKPNEQDLASARHWWRRHKLKASNRHIISFVGSLGMSVTFDCVLEGLAKLKEQDKNNQYQLVIAGTGPTKEQWESKARQLGLEIGEDVLFPGWIDLPKISALLEITDFALAPYIPGTSMSLPNKFFEYFAYGLPVLSSCGGEAVETLQQGQCGFTYRADIPDHFANILKDIASNEGKMRTLGLNAQQLFKSRFSHDIIHPQAESYFKAVVEYHKEHFAYSGHATRS
jgi:glycosyltransferase involved in cell wall biosynthesis